MTARRAPCWVLADGQGNYVTDWYDEQPVHYSTEEDARAHAQRHHNLGFSPVRRETVCADSAECEGCGAPFDDDPGTHYPSVEDALAEAEGCWYRFGDRVWCNECEYTSPEVAEEKARAEREAMSTPLFAREEITQ